MTRSGRPKAVIGAFVIVTMALAWLAPLVSHPVSALGPFRVDSAATPVDPSPSPPAANGGERVKLPAAPAIDEGSSGPNVRSRPDRQGSNRIPKLIDDSQATTPSQDDSVPRLDDPILRWLPEIMAASEQWGVPPELIAAVMRVESTGEPGVISPSGARGLMQMMPDQIGGQGVPQSMWHDPATNVAAGAQGLYTRMLAQGSWEGAVGAYLGFGCDIWGTCTDAYVRVVFGWAAYYRPIIADPRNSGFRILPSDWAYGPIVLYQVPAPPELEEPPDTPTPTATAMPGEPTATPAPRDPTAAPTQPGEDDATAEPTMMAPTEAPPTSAPTEAPPTQAPTPIPTEPPPPPPTEVSTESAPPAEG